MTTYHLIVAPARSTLPLASVCSVPRVVNETLAPILSWAAKYVRQALDSVPEGAMRIWDATQKVAPPITIKLEMVQTRNRACVRVDTSRRIRYRRREQVCIMTRCRSWTNALVVACDVKVVSQSSIGSRSVVMEPNWCTVGGTPTAYPKSDVVSQRHATLPTATCKMPVIVNASTASQVQSHGTPGNPLGLARQLNAASKAVT